jgi:FKBP12-rapamycin complex-associated protein
MLIIPDLAKLDTADFVHSYFSASLNYLLSQLKKEKERPISFTAIGKVSLVVGSSIAGYLDAIIVSIKESLIAKGKNRFHNEVPAYQCISMLAIAVGPTLTKYMHELLDYMFAGGLTDSLQRALVDLSTNIPPLLPNIQERLLDMLSVILFSRVYSHPGAPGKSSASVSMVKDVII